METKADLDRCFEMPNLCPAFNIRAASRIITQLFDEILKPSGLQITQFSVLVGIHILDKPSISKLARVLFIDRTTLTRSLKPLENEGLIKIIPGDDKRTHFIDLTSKGKIAIQKTIPYWEKARSTVSDEFGEKNLEKLLKDLEKLRTVNSLE